MAKKKTETNKSKNTSLSPKAYIENAGVVLNQEITSTLETNYMPYAMSVIVSRAIPEIDGFKPSHRKLLYTMYKMGLLNGVRTKSANIVGQTMKLNPHGDAAIYETMVRLSEGNEALLHPYIDSKGNFGKSYSHDMAYAASRYTEAKLSALSSELFRDIDKDTVDFVDNYDSTMKEPTLFPVTFPSILVNSNLGIAVGMACNICSFNLEEVCSTTIELIKNPNHNILSTLKAPDFAGGGQIVYHADEIEKIYQTGRGSFKVRAKYHYDAKSNCLEITEIPPTTTTEAIIDKVVELVKAGKLKEVSDMRDETDLSGLTLAIDLKRGADPDKLMQKLYRFTPLEDSFSCNFNVLINGSPKVLGVRELLEEWISFRTNCVKRRVSFDLQKKKDKLHLLNALEKILLDIDKAIKIVRETKEEIDVVPNLMIGFGIDEIQAEYVAEIKLRHLNKEYILKRLQEVEQLKKDIAELEAVLGNDKKIKNIIISELKEVIKKHAKERRSILIYKEDIQQYTEKELKVDDYPVHIFFTKEGYFKKITPSSYRMSSEHYLKDGDEISVHIESTSGINLLFFTDKGQVYKSKANEFDDTKASALGDFVAAKLGMDEGESVKFMIATADFAGSLLFFYANGKVAKVSLKSYETKTNRRKLINAYNTKLNSPLVQVIAITEEQEILVQANGGRKLIFHSGVLLEKAAKDNQGAQVMTLKKGDFLEKAEIYIPNSLENEHRYKPKSLPARGNMNSEK